MQINTRSQKSALLCAVWSCVLFFLAANHAAAQTITTNALDFASDTAYANDGPPDGLSPGGENGGSGFAPWSFTVNVSGGAFVAGNGPGDDPNFSFDLWNNAENANTIAIRPFASPLSAGQSFSVQIRLNSLDGTLNTNMLALEDTNGDILFSYFHLGGDNLNGHYTDATTNNGTASNFPYDYQRFDTFTFTLNTPTNYTFTDNSSGVSISGEISNAAIAQVAFIRGNGAETPGNGQDFQFDALQITTTAGTIPPSFSDANPISASFSVPTNTAISVQILQGGASLSASGVTLTVDGALVTPTITNGAAGSLGVNYQPPISFAAGTTHAVQLVVVDGNHDAFTNTWNFTTAFATLPAVLPGPMTTSNNVDIVIFTTNDAWVGANYNANSSKTLFVSFAMEFNGTNDTASIYTFGGLDFYQDNNEKLLVGKNGGSPNWSTAYQGANEGDLPAEVLVVTNDWHKFVVRLDYSPGESTTANVWLDPDLTQPEISQPILPLTLTVDNTFNNIHLRSGFADARGTFSNIVASAQSPFAQGGPATFQGFLPGQNATSAPIGDPISVEIVFGTYSISTNNVTLNLDGANVTPGFAVTSNSITATYQPPGSFVPGSSHTVTVNATDSNGTPYSTTWSFTVDSYPSLPVTAPGPFQATTGNDVILWTSQNGWIGTNYGPNSTNTLYGSFSMTFNDLNGETGSGGGFGGLEFYLEDTEQFLIGNNWASTNWSVSVETGSTADIPPATPIILGTWHVLAVKSVYHPNTNAQVEVWLDPDFTKTEGNQPNPPLSLSINNTFDNIHLRAGNGTAEAEYTNIVFAATAQGVGFAAAVAPGVLSIQNASGSIQVSWTGIGPLQTASTVTGPWSDSANQSNPQALSATNAAQFYRLRQ
jgi:hypothetical protein